MLNRYLYIVLVLISFASCKKQTIDYDREKELPKDTLTLMSKFSYTITSTSEANVTMGFLKFNQLQSETNYSTDTFVVQDPNSSYNFTIQNSIVLSPLKLNEYSTIVLFEKGNDSWYNEKHNVWFYFRRYLELTQNNVAVGYYETDNPNSPVEIFNRDGGSIFNNKWEDNMEEVIDVTSSFNGYNLNLKDVIDKIDQTITIYSSSYSFMPNKSITTFLPNDYSYFTSDTLLINNLINRAISEGIELNFITDSKDVNFQEIAYKTGGMLITNIFEKNNSNYDGHTKVLTYVGVAIENLEAILLKDYTFHQYDFLIIDPFQSGFGPGITNILSAKYNGVEFQYVIKS